MAYKADKGCATCGERHPACLDFHHRDPSTKEFNIASKSAMEHSLARLMKEIHKCVLLCSNCHRKLHYKERKQLGKHRNFTKDVPERRPVNEAPLSLWEGTA